MSLMTHGPVRPIGKLIYIVALPYLILHGYFARKPRVRVLIRHDNEILLVKNWLSTQSWSLPGGGIHHNESSLSAAHREIEEEFGITLESDPILLFEAPSPESTTKFRIELFSITVDAKPKVTIDGFEIIDYRWVNIEELNAIATPKLYELVKTATVVTHENTR